MLIEKKFEELKVFEKDCLKEVRSIIVSGFDAIINWEKNSIYESEINLTSDKEDDKEGHFS